MHELEKNVESSLVSRERVQDFGEVFTGSREIEGMLDLVKYECERVDSRFLEPACGSGNFLVAVLKRKLESISTKYKKRASSYQFYAVQAISSLYGIDIIGENVKTCRRRLFDYFFYKYFKVVQSTPETAYVKCVEFILDKNIVQGDALTMMCSGEKAGPIVFAQWSFVGSDKVIRRDYEYHQLLNKHYDEIPGLFSDSPECLQSDEGNTVFIPKPLNKYPPSHYLDIPNCGSNS